MSYSNTTLSIYLVIFYRSENTKRVIKLGLGVGITSLATLQLAPKYFEATKRQINTSASLKEIERFSESLPTRQYYMKSLGEHNFDVLIIGGGATGTGVALDAASRGMKTCLVERNDFASGTSSRSTKLIHGGVRYLQKAIFNLDIEQFNMVTEALGERANLIRIAPHLASELPIMLPVYKWWQVPYYWVGIKMYDLVSGRQILKASYFLNKRETLENFPMIKEKNLKGSLVYYDGQQEDARMCLSLALTAARYGATISNYTEVISLTKNDETQMIDGAMVKNLLNGDIYKIKAKCVINATGPYTDSIRNMTTTKSTNICQPSSGTHIIIDGCFVPENLGLLDPATKDGRIIFFLPWQNRTLVGTTDTPCKITNSPTPTEDDIQFILGEVQNYFNSSIKIKREHVKSAWSGIRPLVKDVNSKDTQSIARNHIIEVSSNGLITIAGGKWTTYRHMAEETVDKVFELTGEEKKPCITKGLLLEGAHRYHPDLYVSLTQKYRINEKIAKHLATTYGTRSFDLLKTAKLEDQQSPSVGRQLHPEFPYIEEEIIYACQEYACTIIDVIARRTRLAFLDAQVTKSLIPRISEIMAKELNWNKDKIKKEISNANEFLETEMGLGLNK